MQAPHRRRPHTAVAIEQAKHYPCGKSARCITPAVNLRPSQTTLRHCKPSGYTGAHQLVRLVRLVRQVRHKRHAPGDCTPPLPSNRQRQLCSQVIKCGFAIGYCFKKVGFFNVLFSAQIGNGAGNFENTVKSTGT